MKRDNRKVRFTDFANLQANLGPAGAWQWFQSPGEKNYAAAAGIDDF